MHNAQGSKGKTENTECKNGALAKSLVRSNYTLRTKKYTVIDDLDSLGAAWTIKPWLLTPREAPLSMARKIEKWCVGTRISNYSVEKREKRDARRRDPSIVR